jgi:hypothetical protein
MGMKGGDEGPEWERGKEPRGEAESNHSEVRRGGLVCSLWEVVVKGNSLEGSCRRFESGENGGSMDLTSGHREDEIGSEAAQRVNALEDEKCPGETGRELPPVGNQGKVSSGSIE